MLAGFYTQSKLFCVSLRSSPAQPLCECGVGVHMGICGRTTGITAADRVRETPLSFHPGLTVRVAGWAARAFSQRAISSPGIRFWILLLPQPPKHWDHTSFLQLAENILELLTDS